jgi:predicted metal-dependent peptidase
MSNYTPHEKLRIARMQMMNKHLFFGSIAIKLNFVEDNTIPTAAVDGGDNVYYNAEWIGQFNMEKVMFILAHEISHLIHTHVQARGSRHPVVWNFATDYSINRDLKEMSIGEFLNGALYDKKWNGMNSIEIYDKLLKDAKKLEQQAEGNGGKAGHDSHDKWGKNPDGTPKKKDEMDKWANHWQSSAIQAAHACRAAGKEVPDSFKWLIEDLTDQKIDWRSVIIERIKQYSKEHVTWSKINRRRRLGTFNYPGVDTGDSVSFAVFFDTSGSISKDDTKEFLSQVYYATQEFEDVTVDVACFDTRVYNHQKYDRDNMGDLLSYEMQGGGGTDAKVIFDWLKKNHKKPAQIFVFTDMCFSFFADPQIAPVTWLSTENSGNCPFGEILHYRRD